MSVRKVNGVLASEWQAPPAMIRIAKQRTTDIVGVWVASFRWGTSTVQILAESCYMQAVNDVIDAINQRNLLRLHIAVDIVVCEGAD